MQSYEVIFGCVATNVLVLFWTYVISKIIALFAGGGASLVVKELAIHASEKTAAESRVSIVGRREGLLSFLLTLVGLSPTTTLTVNCRESVCRTSGLLGVAHQSIPMDRVAQVTSGSKVAFEYIVYAGMVGLIGLIVSCVSLFRFDFLALIGVLVVTAVFMAIGLLLYHFNKRFYVGVHPQGGWPMLLVFKPNVIEGVQLNLDRALEIAATIRSLVVDARGAPGTTMGVASESRAEQSLPQDFRGDPSGRVEQHTPLSLLRDAQQQIRAGDRDSAVATLQYLIRHFPGTPESEQAIKSLSRAGVKT